MQMSLDCVFNDWVIIQDTCLCFDASKEPR